MIKLYSFCDYFVHMFHIHLFQKKDEAEFVQDGYTLGDGLDEIWLPDQKRYGSYEANFENNLFNHHVR